MAPREGLLVRPLLVSDSLVRLFGSSGFESGSERSRFPWLASIAVFFGRIWDVLAGWLGGDLGAAPNTYLGCALGCPERTLVVSVVSMLCLWFVLGLSLMCLWCVSERTLVVSVASMLCLWFVLGLSLMCLWSVSGVSLVRLWVVSGLSLVCLWSFSGLSLVCLWSFDPVNGPESVGFESVGLESVGPEGVGSEGVGPDGVSPESVGPESVGSESVGPESVGSESVWDVLAVFLLRLVRGLVESYASLFRSTSSVLDFVCSNSIRCDSSRFCAIPSAFPLAIRLSIEQRKRPSPKTLCRGPNGVLTNPVFDLLAVRGPPRLVSSEPESGP